MILRALQILLMILSLAATGVGVAQARVMAGPAGQVVICTEFGTQTVLVDANGQPVSPARGCDCGHCLDCPKLPTGIFPSWSGISFDRAVTGGVAVSNRDLLPIRLRWFRDRPRGPPSLHARGIIL